MINIHKYSEEAMNISSPSFSVNCSFFLSMKKKNTKATVSPSDILNPFLGFCYGLIFNVSQRPCVKGLVTRPWCHWEIEEPLEGRKVGHCKAYP